MELHEAKAHWFCRHDGVNVYCSVCHARELHGGLTIEMVFEVEDDE